MAINKNPFDVLQEYRARMVVSQRYAHRVDHQDPDHQDQLDKNRIPGGIENGLGSKYVGESDSSGDEA
jgi:hypothetical protein